MRVLVTRPQAEAERTAAKLRARGVDVLLAPLLHIEPVVEDFGTGPWSGLILTSANAARALARHPRRAGLTSLPVFTVGPSTADAARAAGCGEVRSADGDQRDLVRLIAGEHRPGAPPLLYLAGDDRAGDLAADLKESGIAVRTVVLYRAVTASQFPPDARAALAVGMLDGVLHFSRRSVQAYLDCARAENLLREALAPAHYCISRQAAVPLAAAGATLHIAPHPDEDAMVALVGGR